MSEQTVNPIIPQQGATNETLLGDFTSYFRYNEESRQYEMNVRISPKLETESWVVVPSPLRDALVNPDRRPAVGTLIYDLVNANLRANREKAAVDEVRQQAWKIVEIIGDRLRSEAESRGWCSEYDDFVSQINAELPGPFALPEREKEYEVTWTETFTVTVNRSATYMATSAEDAEDMAREDYADASEVIDAIRNGMWESDNDGFDYDVQEV